MATIIGGYDTNTASSQDSLSRVTVSKTSGGNKTAMDVLDVSGLVPDKYDYIALGYTGSNLTTVEYYTGGAPPGGTLVATLTLAYTGSQLDSVTKT